MMQPLQPGLGRIASPDARDDRYPLRAVMARPKRVFKRRHWRTGPLLDQGQTSTCVGHAWRNWLNCTPVPTKPDEGPAAFDIYDHATGLDEWPGNDGDYLRQFGTSVRAGAQYLQSLRRVRSYVWGSDADTVARYVLTTSPVVLGTDWYSGMFEPDAEGIVRPTGTVAGGHAYLMCGVDMESGMAECFNSWGVWGFKGTGKFLLPLDDLDTLLRAGGEACDATEARLVQPISAVGVPPP